MVLRKFLKMGKNFYIKKLTFILFQKLVTPALRRSNLFSPSDITALFGNIMELNSLHRLFYADLLKCQNCGQNVTTCGQPGGQIDASGLMHVIEKHIPTMTIAYS